MPTREHLHQGFMLIAGGHVILATACCYVLGPYRLKVVETAALPFWFLGAFTLGYPNWCLVMALKRANTQGRLKHL